MSEEGPRRSGRFGGIFVAVVVAGSAVGVIGWYLFTNRTGPTIDASGFDISATPQSHHAVPVASAAPAAQQPGSSLVMVTGGSGVSIGISNQASSGRAGAAPGAASKPLDKKEQAHADFKEQARKHDADVRKFAERMTKNSAVIRQYGKDWMSHPDLKKLNDDYMRNHDPVAFVMGLTKAPSLGGMVKQYAGNPAIINFITQGIKEAPGDLTSAAMDVLTNDTVAKNLMSNVANGLGLPSSVTAMIGGGTPVDQKQMVNDVMNSAAAQQGQPAAPPVPASDQQ